MRNTIEFDFYKFLTDMKKLGYENADKTCPCYPYSVIFDLDSYTQEQATNLPLLDGYYIYEVNNNPIINLIIAGIQNDDAYIISNRHVDLNLIPEKWRDYVSNYINTQFKSIGEYIKRFGGD